MSRFVKYCRTLLAGSLVFGGAVAISVVGASLSASPAAAAPTPSHSVISRGGPIHSKGLLTKGLLESIPAPGAPDNDALGGSLDLPENSKADSSAWTVEPSPNVLGKEGSLDADSCGSTSTCMAVGDSFDKAGVQEAFAEALNGSKWTIQKLPQTLGDQGSAFYGVSCTSATACTAVGAYRDSSGVQVGLVEVWNGTSWSIETTPNPSGAELTSLEGVSCTSSSKCVAVGGSEDSSGNVTTLVEKSKGTSWTIEASANPSGAEGSVLRSVSCTSATACTAVGAYFDSSGTELTLAEVSNSTSWSVETTPNPLGAQSSGLSGLSCSSAGGCAAVGDYLNSAGAEEALAEELSAGSWSVEAVPNPSGAQQSLLASVACTTSGVCTAVGGFIDSSGPEMTLAEVWNGTSWSVKTTPDPTGSQLTYLAGVSCTSATVCTAVGEYVNGSGVGVSLAEARNGNSWSIQATKNSKGTAQSSQLIGVACTSASQCIAVGASVGSIESALVEVWNGTSWSIQPTPPPPGAEQSGLSGVACTTASACTAVGGYIDSSGVQVTLAEGWNGVSWSVQTTPVPSGATNSYLSGVACTSASACTAVGDYYNSSGVLVTLAEAWNGTSWSIETTPVPSGALQSNLFGVSCSSAGTCTAVGVYTDSSSNEDALAEGWNGTSWSIEATPAPSGALATNLAGVSCSSTGTCTAVGLYYDSSGTQDTLAEAWNGSSWSVQATPAPSGAEGSNFGGVSCISTSACTAVGAYEDSSGNEQTLAETWNGTSWSVQTTATPSGGLLPTLSGVACTTAGCTAVGDYDSISGISLTLVEVGPSP